MWNFRHSRRSVEFLLDLVKKGELSRSDYIEFLDRLVKRKRLSKEKRSFFEEV
jgi:polyhydroxyalkanoate synthesis regulator phasin